MSGKIDKLIINSPYAEPSRWWRHDRDTEDFSLVEGRRPAGYFVAKKGAKYDDDGIFFPLDKVNSIRPKVKAWREAGYPGVTGTARALLDWWHDRTARPDSPFFFCQLEAAETLIWLAETREGAAVKIDGDGGSFARVCTKLCTGGGKTIVMAMLIAWQVCSKSAYPSDTRFTKNILIVAPNLTVKKRLEVLQTGGSMNYYDRFCVVPPEMRERLNQSRIVIQNWQAMMPEKPDPSSVDKRGPKSDNAFCREIVGGMKNVLVINDEAHHAWRVKPEDKKAATKEEREEATVWMKGLDRIDRARGILCCYDFSATPFVPGRGNNDADGLFSWIVSDFSLSDGIESGLVKTPRLVVRDDALPDAKTYKPKLWHIYADPAVKNDLNSKQNDDAVLPDLVRNAYMLLGADWKATFDEWTKRGKPVPPVMITVANNTATAARVEHYFNGGVPGIPELGEPDKILRIDSGVLGKVSASAADSLREKADTVGQEGQAGGGLRSVISVGMLSEGWDARTVTHIMGLRAFTSQLLCEQVVGRGLRRTSYDVLADGELFTPEYVNIFGIPFTFLPYEDEGTISTDNHGNTDEVKVLPERREYMISWPEVTRLEYVMKQKLSLDVHDVPEIVLEASDTSITAELAPVIDGHTSLAMCSAIDLERLYSAFRMQSIIFNAANKVYDEMLSQWQKEGVKLAHIGQVIRLTEEYLRGGAVRIKPAEFASDPVRRKILLSMNMERLIRHLWGYIRSENVEEVVPLFAEGRRVRSTEEMRKWWTARPNALTQKSHINRCVFDSTWESSEAYRLENNPDVSAWAKNDHLGFHVSYMWGGSVRRYVPDFLVRLSNGRMLVLEVKGRESEQDKAKREALSDWVRAVNGVKVYGEWVCDVSRNPADVDGIIARHL